MNWASIGRLPLLILAGLLVFAPARASGDRVALVIGNSTYQHMPTLENPIADAKAMAEELSQLGFENGRVEALLDLTLPRLLQAVRAFGERARDAKLAVVYYSGHGLQLSQPDGTDSYLLPVDANLGDARDVPRQALALRELLSEAGRTQGGVVVLLDACRNNPATSTMAGLGTRGAARSGLIPVTQASLPLGVLVSYATSGGDAAEDGSGRHSPYAAALLKQLPTPGRDVAQVLRRVRLDVLQSTGGRQRPEIVDNLNGDVFLGPVQDPAVPSGPDPLAIETALWNAVRDSTHREDFAAYLERFPQGVYAGLARNRLAALSASTETAHQAELAHQQQQAAQARASVGNYLAAELAHQQQQAAQQAEAARQQQAMASQAPIARQHQEAPSQGNSSAPHLLIKAEDWTAATHLENGQATCYAFTRAISSEPVLPGRGSVILTVTERPSGRDTVAINAGFVFPTNATVSMEAGVATVDFYTAQAAAFAHDGRAAVAAFRTVGQISAHLPGPNKTPFVDTFSLRGFNTAYAAILNACPQR